MVVYSLGNMWARVSCVVVLVCGLVSAGRADPGEDKDWWDSGLTVVQRSLSECEAAKDVSSCLKIKAVRAMDRALNSEELPMFGGLTLVKREDPESRSGRALPALPALPRDQARRSMQMDDLLWGRIQRFIDTRSLQLSLPRLASGDGEFEGRKKLKKIAGPAILIMVMAAYKLAMMMAGVAMLSGKALIVSKVALTLAGVAVLKKLLSHGEHEKTTVEIVKTPQVSHSHSYSSQHDHDDHGYHDKSWPPMAAYTHRSLTPALLDENAEAMGTQPAALQDVDMRRDYRSIPPHYESLSIHSHDPLRIVVSDNGEEDIRVHHRQRGLDLPVLAGGANSAFLEEPIDYSQFGEVDRGAWRGLGSALPVTDSRSLRTAPSSELQERSLDGSVNEEAGNYQPRSFTSDTKKTA